MKSKPYFLAFFNSNVHLNILGTNKIVRAAQAEKNGSLFDVFLATVKENNEENEMSSKFAFSRLKMGEVESRVTLETRRVERGYPCLRPPHF